MARGGSIDLESIPRADTTLSPMELWCNESQERYVIALETQSLEVFAKICERERCPFAVVGQARKDEQLTATDNNSPRPPIDIPMELILGKPPRMHRKATRSDFSRAMSLPANIDLGEAARRVLSLPGVGDKRFLITIGDRTITGLVARDQMVGPWQLPVADCAVTSASFRGYTGEAMAIGERTPLALLDSAAAARMAVGEAITNLAGRSGFTIKRTPCCRQTGWRLPDLKTMIVICSPQCRQLAWTCVLRSVLQSPLEKTPCRCRPAGSRMAKRARSRPLYR